MRMVGDTTTELLSLASVFLDLLYELVLQKYAGKGSDFFFILYKMLMG